MEYQIYTETFKMDGTFTISRGSRNEAEVVTVKLQDGSHVGYGECVPYKRYGETVSSVVEQIDAVLSAHHRHLDPQILQALLPGGAARNAMDCALWDLKAKMAAKPVHQLLDLAKPEPVTTVFTLSLDSPEAMERNATKHSHRPWLKMKLGGSGDLERVAAVRRGAPEARLVVDANEAWTVSDYEQMVPQLSGYGVEMIEQPFPADADQALAHLDRPVTICADESCHEREGLEQLVGRYDMINIKLDKTGGLSEALALKDQARKLGFQIMVGCMVGTSLAMAPAVLIAQGVELVDLDGPLLLAEDRVPPLEFSGSVVSPAPPALWG